MCLHLIRAHVIKWNRSVLAIRGVRGRRNACMLACTFAAQLHRGWEGGRRKKRERKRREKSERVQNRTKLAAGVSNIQVLRSCKNIYPHSLGLSWPMLLLATFIDYRWYFLRRVKVKEERRARERESERKRKKCKRERIRRERKKNTHWQFEWE